MDYSYKLPTEQKTVTGSSVTFNSTYPFPLDSCKISFSATQSGTGDPSPTNVRPISGVSSITLNANGSATVINLNGTRYGGRLDVLTGALTLDKTYITLDGTTDNKFNGVFGATSYGYVVYRSFSRYMRTNAICDKFKYSTNGYTTMPLYSFGGSSGVNYTFSFVLPSTITSLSEANAWLVDNPITIVATNDFTTTIQLTPTQLSTIIGNNTYTTDTGTLEIKYQDLQEKSASGSIASFNTSLNMPLSKGEFSVTAWQEGSGDPSPSNIRSIHGWDAVTISRVDKNLFGGLPFAQSFDGKCNGYTIDTTNKIMTYTYSKQDTGGSWDRTLFDKFNANTQYTFIITGKIHSSGSNNSLRIRHTDNSTSTTVNFTDTLKTTLVITSNANKSIKDLVISYGTVSQVDLYYDECGIFEGVVTADDFTSYQGNTYTIQLGDTYYGGYYDSVNGVFVATWASILINDLTINYSSPNTYFYSTTASKAKGINNLYCEVLLNTTQNVGSMPNWSLKGGSGGNTIYIKATDYTTESDLKTAIGNYYIAYELATPVEIQLTPTEIKTLQGDNNIFCNTGDTSISYKDLDIAKLGSYRESFKLPVAWKYEDKTASGSVVSFSTATNLPLVNGEFSIVAYQEGSGDPSTSNIRNIVGYSAVNMTKTGKNLFGGLLFANSLNGITANFNLDTTNKIVSFSHSTKSGSGSYIRPIFNNFKSSTRYTFMFYAKTRNEGVSSSNIRIGYTDGTNSTIPVNSSERTLYIFTTPSHKSVKDLTVAYNNDVLIDVFYDTFGVFEGVVTVDDFVEYSGSIVTKQLGETVYGGSYNSVSGVMSKNVGLKTFVGDDSENWLTPQSQSYVTTTIADMLTSTGYEGLCNYIPIVKTIGNGITIGANSKRVYIGMQFLNSINVTTLEDWKTYLASHNLSVTYPLAEPIETDIGATEIKTFNGFNNIFCDTGDTNITYKDIDMTGN